MHLGHIVPPGDEDIGVVHVLVTAHGFVQAEGGHETGHRAGHAEPGVGLDIVGADTPLEELGGGIAVGDGPLAGAVHRNSVLAVFVDGLLQFGGNDIQGLLHRHLHHLAVSFDLGGGDPVRTVEGLDGVVALHAAEALVDTAVGIALDRHGPVPFHPDQDTATGAAEPAGGLLPGEQTRCAFQLIPTCETDAGKN